MWLAREGSAGHSTNSGQISTKLVVHVERRSVQCNTPFFFESPPDCTKVKNFSHKNSAQLNYGRRKPKSDSGLFTCAQLRTFAASIGPEYQRLTVSRLSGSPREVIQNSTAGAGFDRKTSDKLPPPFNVVKSLWGAWIRIA